MVRPPGRNIRQATTFDRTQVHVKDAGMNPFPVLDIPSGNRLYFFTAA
jgi:hypothetical protein